MAFYSWPSQGTLQGYPADEASIDASQGVITELLIDVAQRSGASRVHLIAHSMGNRGDQLGIVADPRMARLVDRRGASRHCGSGCRPGELSGCTEHSRQVAFQGDFQLVTVGLEQDGFDQSANRGGGS